MEYFRSKRLKKLYETFSITSETKIIDIGGNLYFWDLAKQKGFSVPKVTIINIVDCENPLPDGFSWVKLDACNLPYKNKEFDIAFCNSVIEHVGGFSRQKELAASILGSAKQIFIQTPDKYSPFEFHLRCFFAHWFSKEIQTFFSYLLSPNKYVYDLSYQNIKEWVDSINLLTFKDLKVLFPDCKIVRERFLLVPKSFIITRVI